MVVLDADSTTFSHFVLSHFLETLVALAVGGDRGIQRWLREPPVYHTETARGGLPFVRSRRVPVTLRHSLGEYSSLLSSSSGGGNGSALLLDGTIVGNA